MSFLDSKGFWGSKEVPKVGRGLVDPGGSQGVPGVLELCLNFPSCPKPLRIWSGKIDEFLKFIMELDTYYYLEKKNMISFITCFFS